MTAAGGGGSKRGSAADRDLTLRRLDDEVFDMLVVGGGATGAGIARDAALRGLRVAIVEAGDFAGETSSHSSKLIHGGLRYLQYGDLRLVFEALTERRRLMAAAPHLCRPVEFLFPAYRGLPPRLGTLGAGILLYNALALWRPPVGGRRLDARTVTSLSPLLRSADLQGAQLYIDCQTDDARLVLETVLDAVLAGAAAAPRVIVTELVRDRHHRIRAARARDRLGGHEIEIRARLVVNATGPFSDAFDRGRHNLRPTLGVHLVLDAARLPHGGRATVLRSPRDGRLVFLLPAGVRSIIGTTDTDWTPRGLPPGPPRPGDAITARASDVDYLLEVANASFPTIGLTHDDVISTFAGLRPLVAVPSHTASATSREHELVVEGDGLLTIIGGKLTTYRRMGQEVVDVAIERLRDGGFEGPIARCSTATRPLPGGRPEPAGTSVGGDLPPDMDRHLRRTYGSRLQDVLSCIAEMQLPSTPGAGNPVGGPGVEFASRIVADLPYCWGEVLYASRHEMVNEVEDVLRRRIPLFRDSRDRGIAAAPLVTEIVGDALGWSRERRVQSLASYREAVARSLDWQRPGRHR